MLHNAGQERPDISKTFVEQGPKAAKDRIENAEPYKPEPKTAGRPNGRDHAAKTKGRVSETTEAILALLPDHIICDADIVPKALPQIIKGILPLNGTGELVGPSGAKKSFVALDMSCAIASGEDFFGHKVRRPGGVFYFAAEGAGGIGNRFAAAKKHRNITRPLPFLFTKKAKNGNARNLKENRDLEELIADLKLADAWFRQKFNVPLRLVIIDTLSQAFAIEDENSNAQVADICRRLLRIEAEVGAFCLGVHHTGKDAEKGARGASAHRANNDIELTCAADRNQITGECSNHRFAVTKSRDGREGPIGGYELTLIELGVDEDGEPFDTLAVEFTGIEAGKPSKNLTHSQQVFDAAFNEAVLVHGREIRIRGDGPKVHAVNVQHVRQEFNLRYGTGETDKEKRQDATRKAFGRCLRESAGRYGLQAGDAGELLWKL